MSLCTECIHPLSLVRKMWADVSTLSWMSSTSRRCLLKTYYFCHIFAKNSYPDHAKVLSDLFMINNQRTIDQCSEESDRIDRLLWKPLKNQIGNETGKINLRENSLNKDRKKSIVWIFGYQGTKNMKKQMRWWKWVLLHPEPFLLIAGSYWVTRLTELNFECRKNGLRIAQK